MPSSAVTDWAKCYLFVLTHISHRSEFRCLFVFNHVKGQCPLRTDLKINLPFNFLFTSTLFLLFEKELERQKYIYTKGCVGQFEKWLQDNLIIVAGIFVGIALLQVSLCL